MSDTPEIDDEIVPEMPENNTDLDAETRHNAARLRHVGCYLRHACKEAESL